jgi:hypothetical protein
MRNLRRCFALTLVAICFGACGNDSNESSPPPGACKTGGTATGSFEPGCQQCAKTNCNAELSQKSGSGWADQYFGGDGACAAFNGCICGCAAASSDPNQVLSCSGGCITKLDMPCQSAIQTADKCIRDRCAAECR